MAIQPSHEIGRVRLADGTTFVVAITETTVTIGTDGGRPQPLSPMQAAALSGWLIEAATAISHPQPVPPGVQVWPTGTRHDIDPQTPGRAQRIAARLTGWDRMDRR